MIRRAACLVGLPLLLLLLTACRSEIDIEPEVFEGVRTPAVIYQSLSPSMAYITVDDGSSGSGVLIEGGYVLTSQHVVEINERVDVHFPDGTSLSGVPVASIDIHADLALVGPLDVDVPVTELVVREPAAPGDQVYLLGYPDEFEAAPEVTITQGIVSRNRNMELYDFGFTQVDALISPGQSGGILANDFGEVIGISGLRFGEASFGLAIASADLIPLVDRLREATDAPVFADPIDRTTGSLDPGEVAAWLVEVTDGSLEVTAESDDDLYIEVVTYGGYPPTIDEGLVDYLGNGERAEEEAFADDNSSGSEQLLLAVENGLYVVGIGTFSETQTEYAVRSFPALQEFPDIESERSLEVGTVALGAFDHPFDIDYWLVELDEGDRVRVVVDSIADAVVEVRQGRRLVASADDSELGVFGTSAAVEFDASESGTFTVGVGRYGIDSGGYAVLVEAVE